MASGRLLGSRTSASTFERMVTNVEPAPIAVVGVAGRYPVPASLSNGQGKNGENLRVSVAHPM